MSDGFLTSLLQVVIVIDVIGAIAYFVLGVAKKRKRSERASAAHAQTSDTGIPTSAPWAHRIAAMLHLPWPRHGCSEAMPATETDFSRLRFILDSFHEGLT